jgi:AAA domain (dynein-related subfamily)
MSKAKATPKDIHESMELIKLSSSELMDVMETSFATPMDGYPGQSDVLWGLPILIEGEPGIAKTARIKQVATQLKADLFIFFAAPHPPESFAGALIPDGKGDAVNVVALSELRACIKAGTGILFLDEINGAAPATQGAIQSLIHERKSGGSTIPGEIRIIAAQNPEDIATAGYRLSPPVANRFVHVFDSGPTEEEWVQWSTGSDTWKTAHTLESLVELVTREWPNTWPSVQGLFAAFMSTQHGAKILHNRPPLENPNSSRAWPSHRTWDFGRRAWATSLILKRTETIRDSLLESCIGPGAATTFISYANSTDIPSPMEVLSGKWQITEDRIDIVLAAYTSTTGFVVQCKDRNEQLGLAPKMWEALDRLRKSGLSDIIVPSVKSLLGARLGSNASKDIAKAAQSVLVPLYKEGLVAQDVEAPKP